MKVSKKNLQTFLPIVFFRNGPLETPCLTTSTSNKSHIMKILSVISIFFVLFFGACDKPAERTNNQSSEPYKSLSERQIVDLSHAYSDKTVYWVTAKEFELDTVFKGQTEKGYYYAANNFSTAEHGGTHLDAPIHFAKGGQTVEEIPLEKLVGKAIKVDVTSKALNNPDYLITSEDMMGWEQEHKMKIPEGSIVLLQTGFSRFYPDKEKYLGTSERGGPCSQRTPFSWTVA